MVTCHPKKGRNSYLHYGYCACTINYETKAKKDCNMLKNLKKRNTTIEPVKNISIDARMAYFMAKHLVDAMQANWDGVVAAGYEQEYKAVCDLRDQCREMLVNNIDNAPEQ